MTFNIEATRPSETSVSYHITTQKTLESNIITKESMVTPLSLWRKYV